MKALGIFGLIGCILFALISYSASRDANRKLETRKTQLRAEREKEEQDRKRLDREMLRRAQGGNFNIPAAPA